MGYIGSSKKDLDDLIDSIQKPGVVVKRVRRVKESSVVYRFSKDGKQMFSLLTLLVSESDEWKKIEVLIKSKDGISDPVREGDDGYWKARELYQLAERMYEIQRKTVVKSVKQEDKFQQVKAFCDVFCRTR